MPLTFNATNITPPPSPSAVDLLRRLPRACARRRTRRRPNCQAATSSVPKLPPCFSSKSQPLPISLSLLSSTVRRRSPSLSLSHHSPLSLRIFPNLSLSLTAAQPCVLKSMVIGTIFGTTTATSVLHPAQLSLHQAHAYSGAFDFDQPTGQRNAARTH